MKRLTLLFIAIFMMISGSIIIVHGEDINTDTQDITIISNDNALAVIEDIKIDVIASDTFTFWLQGEATDIVILIDDVSIDYQTTDELNYTCNISGLDITKDTSIQISYNLIRDVEIFKKVLHHNTSQLEIKLDDETIYYGEDLGKDSYIAITLKTPIENVTETETIIQYQAPTWIYVIIIILIIVVLLSFVFPSKKQKTTKTSTSSTGSEELLSTKKTLLMEILKDIEKQHRAKQISDDTYHKLKDQYKQEAVEAMKKLEDMQSKVK